MKRWENVAAEFKKYINIATLEFLETTLSDSLFLYQSLKNCPLQIGTNFFSVIFGNIFFMLLGIH